MRGTDKSVGRLWLWFVVIATLLAPMAAVASEPAGPTFVDRGNDVIIEIGELNTGLTPQATDPLGLLVGVDTIRDHSLGTDRFDVWQCGTAENANVLAADLNDEVAAWFAYQSRGRYQPVFTAKGDAGNTSDACQDTAMSNASSNANGTLLIVPQGGGFASPGFTCGFTPCPYSELVAGGNGRRGFIGNQGGFHTTAAHEIGHMLSWPHSNTGGGDQYDNASDLMSGNYGMWGNSYGSYPDPYSTAVINFYAAGWIDPNEVFVHSGSGGSVALTTQAGSGAKMAVIQAGPYFYTLAARVPSEYDPIPAAWSGVEVYRVEKCAGSESACLNGEWLPGYRKVVPWPAVPFNWQDTSAYSKPLPHMIRAGQTRNIAGVDVAVSAGSGGSFNVTFGEGGSFTDITGNVFASDIEWLAESGITRGCNPPLNDRFCPDAPVTRGAMAAFLHRALPDLTAGAATNFVDDNGHVFESDIAWLSATGVTRGCNPPTNDQFCPDAVVTRGAMAAFLHRALPDLPAGPATNFVDDNGHVFESDIAWLAATGVTRGCNPPTNDRFCPDAPVTRGAMAAFLHRALGG